MKRRTNNLKLKLIMIIGVLVALVAMHQMNAQNQLLNDKTIMKVENVKEMSFLNIPLDSQESRLDTQSTKMNLQFKPTEK